ncbi:MAG: hypothetical protein HZA24_05680 [Nitrospirae bacterium]|nr:hypothetical protein [Nitrospirota bacterium]
MAPATHMAVGECAPPPEAIAPRGPEPFAWAHPLPQGDNLLGMAGSAPGNLWAVGDKGRILHFDGRRWTRQDTAATDYLAGVWAAPSGAAFVTGYNGRVLHFDGSRWENHPTGVSNDFNGIWGSGPDDVFAVADRGVIFHWDGRCWARQDSGTENLFFGVWGSGPADVWAVGGRGNVAHYDGLRWQPVDVGVDAHFVSVWGTGPDNVYIAGDGGVLLHRTGGAWTREALDTDTLLRWIWGTGPADAWVAGDDGVVRHFDGHAWRPVDIGTAQAVRGGWAADGVNGLVGDDGLLMAGAGTALAPARTGPFADLAATAGDWAVGTGGSVLRRDADGRWRPEEMGAQDTLGAVAALADGRVLAAERATLWLRDGRGWRTLANPAALPVRAIRAWNERAVAVTELGTLLTFDGTAWAPLPGPMDGTPETPETLRSGTANGPGAPALFGLGGRAPDDLWLVGPAGRAFHFDGRAWADRSMAEGEDLTAVSASGVAVGMGGGAYRWENGGWRRLTPAGGLLSLYAVVDDPAGGGWAAGDFGTILRIEGGRVTPLSGVTGQSLWGAAVTADGRVQLVGDGGTILERPGAAIKIK